MKNQKNKTLKKLNLGCGVNVIPGKEWTNVDKYYVPKPKPVNFVKADIKDLPFDKNTFDYVLCEQTLEHMTMDEIPAVLSEIRRVLKKGGKATIVVPDFRSIVSQWMDYNWEAHFNPMIYKFLSEVIYGNQMHPGEFHKTPITGGFLFYALNNAGLKNHVLVLHNKDSLINLMNYDGLNFEEGAVLRNAQIVAKIIKDN